MRYFYFISIFLFGISSTINAQINQAIIKYEGAINEKYVESFLNELKEKDIPMSAKQGVIKMYENATPDHFFLNIDGDQSYYYLDKTLESDLSAESYNVGSKAGTTAYFTNNSNDLIIEFSNALGNINHQALEWELSQEKKNIIGFTCYRATSTEKLYSRQGHFYYRDVVAWFAPEIPLNFGPKHYKGLPGLILEINRDEFTISATEINLSPEEEKVKIKGIGNKKYISQEESYKQIEEFMEDNRN
ncbi:GLPGLI family protein [Salegentibacter sp. HM20]